MRLEVSCEDRVGLAKDILTIMENYGINLFAIDASNQGFLYLQFADINFEVLSELMPLIRKVSGVNDVRTVTVMPSEQEHYALKVLLRNLPDGVFSIDIKGRVTIVNEAALHLVNLPENEVLDQPLNNYLQGVNLSRWLTDDRVQAQALRVQIADNEYLAEMLPIYLSDEHDKSVLAGAVITLKSLARVGAQFHALQNQEQGFENVLGSSEKMQTVLKQARRMAQLNAPLLISGETGSGKELMARATHDASTRRDSAFITVNCAAMADIAVEEVLFGKVEAGQIVSRGFFDEAQGGTVFFDEISEMSKAVQMKLLSCIEDNTFRRVGSDKEVVCDVRIICSSQQNLAELCQQGKFREDLFYRIDVLSYHMPALRDRQTDILTLADTFLSHYSQQLGTPLPKLSLQCREYLLSYAWPGNVRQLKNAILKAISVYPQKVILESEDLQLPSYAEGFGYFDDEFEGSLETAMKEFESDLLRRLYPAFPSTRQLARKLGVSHTAIANKLREYNITKPKKAISV